MPEFNAKEFYTIGVKIANSYEDEAGYRTAIGRVYYACHLVGVFATSNKGWFHPTHTGDDHAGLWRALKQYGKYELADKIRALYALREHADYHIMTSEAVKCVCCSSVAKGANLVDFGSWQRAKEIATYILPKLENINPEKSRK